MTKRYEGKHVVVTGASSGIGRAIATAFGAEGAHVWMGARNQRRLAEAAQDVEAAGGTPHALALDVTSEHSVAAFTASVARDAPGVDALVNNAGIGAWGAMEEMDVAKWKRVIDTNLTGPFLMTKAMLPLLRKRDGRRHVINIISVSGKTGMPNGGTYAASKFGLRGWTEAIAQELAPEGIRVVGVLPGYVATPLVSQSGEAERMIQPDDLGRTIVDLTLVPESLFIDEIVVWPWKMYSD